MIYLGVCSCGTLLELNLGVGIATISFSEGSSSIIEKSSLSITLFVTDSELLIDAKSCRKGSISNTYDLCLFGLCGKDRLLSTGTPISSSLRNLAVKLYYSDDIYLLLLGRMTLSWATLAADTSGVSRI